MVKNQKDQKVFDIGNRLRVEKKAVTEEIEVMEYSYLLNQVKSKKLPLEMKGKYILIKFDNYSEFDTVEEAFYKVQLLGYTPIIADAEFNFNFKRNPSILHSLVNRGALVHINETSLIDKKKKAMRKFIIKLCRHRLVHIISTDFPIGTKTQTLSEKTSKYLCRKVSIEYVNYLQENLRHIKNGTQFHQLNTIKFKGK